MENGESNRSRGQEFGTLGIIVFLSILEVKLAVYPRVDGLVSDANGTGGCPRAFKWLSLRRWSAERHAAAIAESEGRLSRISNPKVPQSRNPSPQEDVRTRIPSRKNPSYPSSLFVKKLLHVMVINSPIHDTNAMRTNDPLFEKIKVW